MPPPEIRALPQAPGVYRFVDAVGEALYLGRASNLRRRTASYWPVPRGRPHLVEMLSSVATVQAVRCRSQHEAAWLERSLLERELLPWNRTPGGAERPVYIEVVPPPKAAVSVTHRSIGRDGSNFGPFLGGGKSRLLVSALRRSFPAFSSLSPGAGDPTPVIVEIMSGAPQPISQLVSGLTVQRDAAARVLAFELAEQISAEIAAVEWLLAPQRVVSGDRASEFSIGASSDRMYVGFTVRGGSIVEWVQDAEAEAGDGPVFVDGTPPDWHEFVLENLALATALRRAAAPH